MKGPKKNNIYKTRSLQSLLTFLYFLFSSTLIFFNSIIAKRTFAIRKSKSTNPNLKKNQFTITLKKSRELKNKNFAYFGKL